MNFKKIADTSFKLISFSKNCKWHNIGSLFVTAEQI